MLILEKGLDKDLTVLMAAKKALCMANSHRDNCCILMMFFIPCFTYKRMMIVWNGNGMV
jgi:hypothetical protein